MRANVKKYLISTLTISVLGLQAAYGQSCNDLKNEIKDINKKQGETEITVDGEKMSLEEAKKQRDSELARALALRALIHVRNDYRDVEKSLNNVSLDMLLTPEASKLFKDAEKNMETVYKYGLLRNYVNMMSLEQALDQSYENRMDSNSKYVPDIDRGAVNLYDYMKKCDNRVGSFLGIKYGMSDNLKEYIDNEEMGSPGQAQRATENATKIIAHHNQLCNQTKQMFEILGDEAKLPGMQDNIKQTLNNMSGLYETIRNSGRENGDWSTMHEAVEEHRALLDGFNGKNPFDQIYAEANKKPFDRTFNAAFAIVEQGDGTLAKAYGDVATQLEGGVLKGANLPVGTSTEQDRKDYEKFQSALGSLKEKCLGKPVSKCKGVTQETKDTFANYLSKFQKGGTKINGVSAFDLDSLEKKKNSEYAKKVEDESNKYADKINNLKKKYHGRSGISFLNSIQSLFSDGKLSECSKYTNLLITSSNPNDLDRIQEKRKLGECLNKNLDAQFVEDSLSQAREDIKKYDDEIAKATRANKEFNDLEKLKFISNINYSHLCDPESKVKSTSVSLIDSGDKCLGKYLGDLTSSRVSGLMNQTNNVITEFIADDYLRELGEAGQSFAKDRKQWIKLTAKYCEGVDRNTNCSEDSDNKMCNTCRYAIIHKQELYLYEQSKAKKLKKGTYREYDSDLKKMVTKRHPISNVWAHTAMYLSKNLGGFMQPRAQMWNFKSNLLMSERNAGYMKQQYHWNQQLQGRIQLNNPNLFQNFYGVPGSVDITNMGMPIATSQ